MPNPIAEDRIPPAALKRLAWLWLAFCVVKIGSSVLQWHAEFGVPSWKPLLWEGSSLLVVTVLVVVQVHYFAVALNLHTRPWLWLRRQLLFLPIFCLLFVPLTYGLRHAVYAVLGEGYEHAGWLQVFVYESVVLSLFYLLWLGVVFGLATREHLLTERIHAQDTALALRDAQLALLRQQLQPHFLFNALNLISALMYENVPRADALLRKFASLLRQTAAQAAQATHSLADELGILRDYADIMAARFEGRVAIDWQIAPARKRVQARRRTAGRHDTPHAARLPAVSRPSDSGSRAGPRTLWRRWRNAGPRPGQRSPPSRRTLRR